MLAIVIYCIVLICDGVLPPRLIPLTALSTPLAPLVAAARSPKSLVSPVEAIVTYSMAFVLFGEESVLPPNFTARVVDDTLPSSLIDKAIFPKSV